MANLRIGRWLAIRRWIGFQHIFESLEREDDFYARQRLALHRVGFHLDQCDQMAALIIQYLDID